MSRFARLCVVVFAVIVFALIGGLLIARSRLDGAGVRARLESALTSSLGTPVRVGEIKLSLRPLGFQARAIEVASPPDRPGKGPFLTLDALRFGVRLLPLFKGEVRIDQVVLDGPHVRLARSKDGRWNIPLGPAPLRAGDEGTGGGGAAAVLLGALRIDGAEIRGGALEGDGVSVFRDLSLEIRDIAATSPLRLRMSARSGKKGSVSLAGTAGPLVRDLKPAPLALEGEVNAEEFDTLSVFRAFSGGETGIDGPLRLASRWRTEDKAAGGFVERLRGEGKARIGSGRLVGFEKWEGIVQAVRMAVRAAPAPQGRPAGAFDEIEADFKVESGILNVSAFRYRAADLLVTGAGRYDLRDGRLDLRLKGEAGGRRVRFAVLGPADRPTYRIEGADAAIVLTEEIGKLLRKKR